MNIKTASISFSVAVLATAALASTACTATTADPNEESSTGESTQPLDGTGFGNGYSCTGAGYCQCSGIADCDDMFRICKSNTYCNLDSHGYRCCCLNYVPLTRGGVSPISTVPLGPSQ